jgi:hypothetical protein
MNILDAVAISLPCRSCGDNYRVPRCSVQVGVVVTGRSSAPLCELSARIRAIRKLLLKTGQLPSLTRSRARPAHDSLSSSCCPSRARGRAGGDGSKSKPVLWWGEGCSTFAVAIHYPDYGLTRRREVLTLAPVAVVSLCRFVDLCFLCPSRRFVVVRRRRCWQAE